MLLSHVNPAAQPLLHWRATTRCQMPKVVLPLLLVPFAKTASGVFPRPIANRVPPVPPRYSVLRRRFLFVESAFIASGGPARHHAGLPAGAACALAQASTASPLGNPEPDG